jgi:hypothetical protein
MSVTKASLWRRAALTLVAGAAIALPMGAQADYSKGLSVRFGGFFPVRNSVRDVTDFAAWGGGVDYKVPWVPRLLNGEHWSSSISADFHYSGRNAGVYRSIPVTINQIYTFEEQNGKAPYAGFGLGAYTFGGSRNGVGGGHQPTVTRFGGGLILGLNLDKHFYLEGRYDFVDSGNVQSLVPEGFRGYVGYRF